MSDQSTTAVGLRALLALSVAIVVACAGPAAAQSATILAKPLKLVVGFPPGGSADTLARALAQQLSGVAPSVIVDNRPGAGGRIALEAVKNSDPDGSTLALTPASMITVYPHIYRKLPYDPPADFAAVARVAAAPFVVAVGPMVPTDVTTLADFVRWGKANPTKASYGSSGAGSIPHFTGVALGKSIGLDWTHVAYKGAAPAMNDLIGGQIAANISVMSNALPHLQAGRLRALAVSAPTRSAELPSVPTFAEAAAKDAAATEWFGVLAPSKTSGDTVQKLNAAINAAMKTKAFQDALAKGAFASVPADSPAAFAVAIKADITRWAGIVKSSGFTPED